MSEQGVRVRVWDFPVRLFHWLLVLLLGFSWWSAEEGHLDWHRLSGYTVLTLILFRLCWGLVGSETARFARFLRGPNGVGAYLKGAQKGAPILGHNPLGGWSVLAMLLLIFAQASLGLFSIDIDGIESGPLAVFVSFDQGRVAAAAHHLIFNIILGLVIFHVVAIGFYAVFKRQNLIGPMITGAKRLDAPPEHAPAMAPLWLAILIIVVAAGLVYAISHAFWAF